MNLYKVTLAYGWDYGKRFSFFVIAKEIELAVDLAIKTFNSYNYGFCIFNHVELMASEGQYSKPDILLVANESSFSFSPPEPLSTEADITENDIRVVVEGNIKDVPSIKHGSRCG